jgi:hypothetical protein
LRGWSGWSQAPCFVSLPSPGHDARHADRSVTPRLRPTAILPGSPTCQSDTRTHAHHRHCLYNYMRQKYNKNNCRPSQRPYPPPPSSNFWRPSPGRAPHYPLAPLQHLEPCSNSLAPFPWQRPALISGAPPASGAPTLGAPPPAAPCTNLWRPSCVSRTALTPGAPPPAAPCTNLWRPSPGRAPHYPLAKTTAVPAHDRNPPLFLTFGAPPLAAPHTILWPPPASGALLQLSRALPLF